MIITKKGNQFFLELEITNDDDTAIDIRAVDKVQFNIDDITKLYSADSSEVTYEEGKFRIWLTEQETFAFKTRVKLEARVLYTNGTILGTFVEQEYFYDSLGSVMTDVEVEDSQE